MASSSANIAQNMMNNEHHLVKLLDDAYNQGLILKTRPSRDMLMSKIINIFRGDDIAHQTILDIGHAINYAWELDALAGYNHYPFALDAARHPFILTQGLSGRSYVATRQIKRDIENEEGRPERNAVLAEYPIFATSGPRGVTCLPFLLLPRNALYHILHLHSHEHRDYTYKPPAGKFQSVFGLSVKDQLLNLLHGILKTNGMQNGQACCLLRKGSMFNHSETPNLTIKFCRNPDSRSESRLSVEFEVLRDIRKNEELCIAYAQPNSFSSVPAYYNHLLTQYGIRS